MFQKNAIITQTEDAAEGTDPSKQNINLQVRGGEIDELSGRGAESEGMSVEYVYMVASEATAASNEADHATGGKHKNADKSCDPKDSETTNQVYKPEKNSRFLPGLKKRTKKQGGHDSRGAQHQRI